MSSSLIPLIPSLKEIDMSGISMRAASSALVPCLNLKDCNLCEGAIPEDIGLLSSSEDLDLGGNHFVSLPARISGLSKLRWFTLRNCESLQKLPSLPSNRPLDFYVNTDNCTSLKIFPDPPPMCNGVSYTSISSFNCFSLIDHQGSRSIISLTLKKFLQEIPRSLSLFDIIIPGSEIPEWFNNQNVGNSVIEMLPSDSNSKWVGFSFCALFAQEISGNISFWNQAGRMGPIGGRNAMIIRFGFISKQDLIQERRRG
ncbi:hypothetical protein L3X38_042208 [Prunus dulcis]|uniref:C-JID domain-containing protein n=1 Tax=Prunus dulcis TaxID=3755 RepID=A0AAD4UUI2_PRUDU|nr:hypothetical protein L3X38_042208 [Prunus dulcis]